MAVVCANCWVLRVVFVFKAGGFGDLVDRILVADQEMPALLGAGALVALQDFGLLFGGGFGSVFGVEAHGDDVEFLADVELQHAQGAFEAGQFFAAEHRAGEVDEIQDQRLLAEVIAEADLAA